MITALEPRATELRAEVERLEQLRRELRAEIVPYEKGGELIRAADFQDLTIRFRSTHPAGKERTAKRHTGDKI
jgi:hypothetical protein